MNIVITQWALDSYLDLKHSRAFTDDEYWTIIRPNVELLRDGLPPKHVELQNHKLFSPATDMAGRIIPDCYKMKWHNLNNGNTPQLRVCIVHFDGEAYLCQAYTKTDAHTEGRQMANLKVYATKIRSGQLSWRELL